MRLSLRNNPDARTSSLRPNIAALAALVLLYHGGHARGDVIEGNTQSDLGALSVSWQYDLEAGFGKIVIYETQGGDPDLWVVFRRLIPFWARNVQVNGSGELSLIQCCDTEQCPSGPDAQVGTITLAIPRDGLTEITFDFENPQLFEATSQAVPVFFSCDPMGDTTCSAGAACSVALPANYIPEFVTIKPIQCNSAVTDGDNDIDLLDFARFQLAFTGPTVNSGPTTTASRPETAEASEQSNGKAHR